MMSNSLDLIMGTIQRLLQGPSSSTGDSMPGHDSRLDMLIFSQLQRTQRLLEDFSEELVLEWHGLIYEKLYRVVTRISTLVRYPGDVSIPAEAKGEHFLEALLDLRWWTWVIALQAKTLLINPTIHDIYFSRIEGVFEAKSSFDGNPVSRRLPSYSFELWQQGTERCWRGILQLISEGKKMGDEGKKELETLLTDMRNAQLPGFDIKQLGPAKFWDAGKPSSIGDYLPIDLTQGLLGASSTGYVIRTTCPDGKGGSYSCALKRIATMDEEPPDLARLWHPHVVHLLHHWREKSGLHGEVCGWTPKSTFMTFLVMELMDGDLAKLMTSCKKTGVAPFSLLVAVDVMLQIAKGMLYLHEMGVSHPHLKCDNILCRVEKKTNAGIQAGFIVKLGGFRCSRTANDDTKNRDVFCFGLTCLEILTGDDWSEDIYGADRVPKPIIPESTPPILKHCIASCLDTNLTFSEVVMLLLLAQCQIMQTCQDKVMLCSDNLHIKSAKTNIRDLASSSTSKGGLHEMFHVHQLYPQLGEGPPSVQSTLIFFHGFPKVSEEWRMTWMTRDNKLVWPQRWLPEDLDGDIRILSVSFDPAFDDDLNVSITQPSKDLLQSLVLSATWNLGETEQAIILVGHSFGGVIIKTLVTEAQCLAGKAVQNSIDREEVMKCKNFLNSLASIVFYSVPHALTNTEFENYISGCSKTRVFQRSSLLKALRGDDLFVPAMIQLSRDFDSAVPHKTKVLAFLEGKPMSKKCFLVTEKSCEGESLSWEWYKIDKDNHFEVCRPDSRSHPCYKILLNHLQQHMFSPPVVASQAIYMINLSSQQNMDVLASMEAADTQWADISDRSMEIDHTEMPEALFALAAPASKKIELQKPGPSSNTAQVEILESRKACNILNQLRPLGLPNNKVMGALLKGDNLSVDVLETLVKVAPTADETKKYMLFDGNLESLSYPDRFFHAIFFRVPHAFSRLSAMLYRAQFEDEMFHVQEAITVLKLACEELTWNRTFTKLLLVAAVSKAEHKAEEFKFDDLLILDDLKVADGKTTLLHFVINRVIISEETRAAIMSNTDPNNVPSTSTPQSPNASLVEVAVRAAIISKQVQKSSSDESREMDMDAILKLTRQMSNVRKAGGLDASSLKATIQKLINGLHEIKAQVREGRFTATQGVECEVKDKYATDLPADSFQGAVENFVTRAESKVATLVREFTGVYEAVKKVSVQFYGEAASKDFDSQPLKIFFVVREFLGMLDRTCEDVMQPSAQSKGGKSS